MPLISPQKFILYSKTFIVPAVCLLFVAGLLNMKAEYSRSRLIDRITLLEGSVLAQEGVRAVKRLQYTFGYCLEMGLWKDLSDLFSDNAVAEFQAVEVKGKKTISDHFMAEAGRKSLGLSKGQLNVHLLMQPVVNLDAEGKTAKGTWHEIAMLGRFGVSASWRGGVYENEYVFENGLWKISRLNYIEQYHGNYDDWGHFATPAWNIPYHFKAEHVGVTIPESASKAMSGVSSLSSVNEQINNLQERIRIMSDETRVRNLQHIYGYYMDRKMWDDIIDLLTDKCTFEPGRRGLYAGKTRIHKALESFYGTFPLRHGELFDHINLATVVTLTPDGTGARARTRQLTMEGINGEYAQWEIGTLLNDFVKEGGIWKIKAIRYYPEMITDYDEGWARDAKPAPVASKDFIPDRWPSRPYGIYPGVYTLAFSYRNPVTGRSFQYPSGRVVTTGGLSQSKKSRTGMTFPDNVSNPVEILPELARRLDAETAVDAVENLNSSYGYYIDESDWDSMADTYAAMGSKEITGVGVYVGRERIRKVLKLRGPAAGRVPDFFTIHQLTQPVIHISADGKSAKARLRLFQCGGSADGTTGSWIGGIYENTAVLENGEWKFGIQDLLHTFNASYRNGWARTGGITSLKRKPSQKENPRDVHDSGIKQGLGGAKNPFEFAKGFPPDRQIRSKQYRFPEIVEPAFHYKNPVSGRMPGELLP